MSTKVASLYAELGVKSTVEETLSAVRQSLISTGGQFGILAAAGITAGAAITEGLNKAGDAAVKYADEVRKIEQLTGLNADASSRLIQVSDDLKISTDDLAKSTKFLAKEGLSLSIETLAKLSDQYLSLGTQAEKNTFLIKNFGKSGQDFAEAMSKGSAALLKMNDAVDKNLILTQQSIDKAREYQRLQDEQQDKWRGLVVTVGNRWLPISSRLLDMTNDLAVSFINLADNGIGYGSEKLNAFSLFADFANGRIEKHKEDALAAADAVAAHGEALDSAAISMDNFSQIAEEDYSNILNMTEALMGASDEQTAKIVYNNLLQKLSVDGLTSSEFEMANAAGVALGVFDEKTATTAANVNFLTDQVVNGTIKVQNLGAAIAGLQDKTVTVTTVLQTIAAQSGANYGGSGLSNQPNKRAGGTPGSTTGGMTWVGEKGPELLDLPSGSRVTSSKDSTKMGGNTFVFNISADYADPETIANRLKPAMTRVMREAGVV